MAVSAKASGSGVVVVSQWSGSAAVVVARRCRWAVVVVVVVVVAVVVVALLSVGKCSSGSCTTMYKILHALYCVPRAMYSVLCTSTRHMYDECATAT